MIARIGPWVEPDGDDEVAQARRRPRRQRQEGRLDQGARLRPPRVQEEGRAPAVEEHLYRSCDCPITEELVDRLAELVRAAQQVAIEQTWPVDWTELADLRREADEAPRRRQAPPRP